VNILVLSGGSSSERAISLLTADSISATLEKLGHTVTVIDIHKNLVPTLLEAKARGIDFVWIALHGGIGENGMLQALLDLLDLPYQGSGHLSSTLAMHKGIAKQIFIANQIQTPSWLGARKGKAALEWGNVSGQLGTPVVIKPVDGGSTLGITIASTQEEYDQGVNLAFEFSSEILLESYISGKELTISVFDDVILPAIEIVPLGSSFYDYESKYTMGGSKHLIPCSLSSDGLIKAETMARKAYEALHCRGLARVDLRIDAQEIPWVLEVNTLPGMTATSLCPDSAAAFGWTLEELVDQILKSSIKVLVKN
jgi:D-alanine-D-alanine ligase